MDEHIGITPKVAASILGKAGLAALLQQEETREGTAQRVHNILLLHPQLLRSTAAQKQVFQLGETVARLLERDEATAPSQLYLLALLRLLVDLRDSFTPKQQTRLPAWSELLSRVGGSAEQLEARVDAVRTHFREHEPFAGLGLAPFRIAGLKHAHLHAKKPCALVAAAAPVVTPAATGEDIPFSFLPRSTCPQCGHNSPFYCTRCFIVLHEQAKGKLPVVRLPIRVDIVLHPAVLRHKSTALQALLVVEPREHVQAHTFPALPEYDPETTAVIFPSDTALTVQQLAERMAPCAISAASSAAGPPCALRSLRRVVFLEGTWAEATLMLQHAQLRHLTHLRLDTAALDEPASDSTVNSAATATSSPSTAFWRFQNFGPGFLSSIEAIYHLLAQYHPHRRTLTREGDQLQHAADALASASSSPTAAAATATPYANLLWLFAMSFGRVQAYYRAHPSLLPPPTMQAAE